MLSPPLIILQFKTLLPGRDDRLIALGKSLSRGLIISDKYDIRIYNTMTCGHLHRRRDLIALDEL